jgi:uncharacterized membrane protein YqjE
MSDTLRTKLSLGWPALVLTGMALLFYPLAFGALVLAVLGLVWSTGRPNQLAAALALMLSVALLAVVVLGHPTHTDLHIKTRHLSPSESSSR